MNYTTKGGLMRVLLATTSAGKIKQYKDLLAKHWPDYRKHIKLYTLKSTKILRSLPEVEEVSDTYHQNAMEKAFQYGKKAHMVSIADDSGVEVYALGNKPGIHSHRDGWDPGQVFVKMLDKANRNAVLFTTVAMYNPFENNGTFFDNFLRGFIIPHPELVTNVPYGYDGIFAPLMTLSDKNMFSVQYLLDHKWYTREEMRYPRAVGFVQMIERLKYLVGRVNKG